MKRILQLIFEDIPTSGSVNNPFPSFLYFEEVKEFIFSKIIGWNTKKNIPMRGRGIFGITKRFFQCD